MIKTRSTCLLIAFFTFAIGIFAHADTLGAHPAYLHALTDIRAARWHLEHRGGSPALQSSDKLAVGEIDQCIDQLKTASTSDGKNLADHPKEDAGKDKEGNVHRARDLLLSARKDIEKPESNAAATPARDQALQHLDAALKQVEQSLTIAK